MALAGVLQERRTLTDRAWRAATERIQDEPDRRLWLLFSRDRTDQTNDSLPSDPGVPEPLRLDWESRPSVFQAVTSRSRQEPDRRSST